MLQKEKSCLLLVDVQEKLAPHVLDPDNLVANCQWLMRLASELDVPMVVSEHYRQGLGSTIEPLRKLMPGQTDINKLHFSCFRDPVFQRHWQTINRKQVVIAGIETHVCVLQTALDFYAADVDVFVVVDAVSSRTELDYRYALERMQQVGVRLVTREMVFFEWIGQAGTTVLKSLSKAFIRRA